MICVVQEVKRADLGQLEIVLNELQNAPEVVAVKHVAILAVVFRTAYSRDRELEHHAGADLRRDFEDHPFVVLPAAAGCAEQVAVRIYDHAGWRLSIAPAKFAQHDVFPRTVASW